MALCICQVAMTHPMAVTNCNIDMESLITDQNRSIATLAITTLLKTGDQLALAAHVAGWLDCLLSFR
jgi:coatomer protein complex subunit gamma